MNIDLTDLTYKQLHLLHKQVEIEMLCRYWYIYLGIIVIVVGLGYLIDYIRYGR